MGQKQRFVKHLLYFFLKNFQRILTLTKPPLFFDNGGFF